MATVLCNAGPLITLGKLNRLDLLAALYDEVLIPRAVYTEAVTQGLVRGMADARNILLFWRMQGWPVVDVPSATLATYEPLAVLHPGETEVLALALTMEDVLVLFDDEVAREEARRLGLSVRGTLGVLVQAFRAGILTLAQTELLLNEIALRPDIWIAARLCRQVLESLQQAEA